MTEKFGRKIISSNLEKLRKAFLSFFQNEFFFNRTNRAVFYAAFVTNIIIWILILFKVRAGSRPLPLHFNAYYGIEFVGNGLLFFELPFIGLAVLAINAFLGFRSAKSDKFLTLLMSCGSFIVQIILLLATLNVIVYLES